MEKTDIQKRIEDIITNGSGYHDSSYARAGRFEDPIQSHLGRMERRNPSANQHKQRFLQWLSGRISLLDRASEYHSDSLIYKHSEEPQKDYGPILNIRDYFDNIILPIDTELLKEKNYNLSNYLICKGAKLINEKKYDLSKYLERKN